MKARIPGRVTKRQEGVIREKVRDEYQRQGAEMSRRIFKLFCVALNKEFGFGKNRLSKLMSEISALSNEKQHDEVFWSHMDKVIIEQIGIDFPREDYEKMDD